MKITSTSSEYQSTVKQGTKMGFAPEAKSFLMDMMSDGLYSDKYGSIVREIASNCVDANTESGSNEPVQIVISKPNSFSNAGELSFSDNGIGISPERIEDIFTLYFASTKRDGNDMIGGFGIGAKSPFAYTDVFRVETVSGDGVMRTYLMEKRGQDRSCTLLSEVPDNGPTGTTIRIPVKDTYDYEKFVRAINEQTVLLRPISVVIADGEYRAATVYEYETFYVAFSGKDGEPLYDRVALGNVVYKYEGLTDLVDKRAYTGGCTVIPKLEIGKVMPTMSRESLQLTDEAREYIKSRMAEVVAEIQGMSDAMAVESDSIIEVLRAFGGSTIALPGMKDGHKINTSLGRYAGRDHLIRRKSQYLAGYEGLDITKLNAYVKSILSTQMEYKETNWRNNRMGFVTKNADHYRLLNFIDGANQHRHSGEVTFVRKNGATKFTAAAKEFIKEKAGKDNVLFFTQEKHAAVGMFRNWAIQLGIYDDDGQMDSEKLRTALYETFGKRFLIELMDLTESEKEWFPSEEWIADRKERMKAARKKTTSKKDRANDEFRMRGIGEWGVIDTTLTQLTKNYASAVYLTRAEVDEVKADHAANSEYRYYSLADFVKEKYERGTLTRLVEVSAKTAKEFAKLGVFTSFADYKAKRAQRNAYAQDAMSFVTQFYNLRSECHDFLDVVADMNSEFKAYYKNLENKVTDITNNVTLTGQDVADIDTPVTELNVGHERLSLKRLQREVTVYKKRMEKQPFLMSAIADLRNWQDGYADKVAEAAKYLYPNSTK